MPSWTENVSTATNKITGKHGATGARRVNGFSSYNRWIRESTDLSFDLATEEVGALYGAHDALRTSKKGLALNKPILQSYCALLQRKLGRSPNVQDVAAFTAVVLLLPPEVTSKGKPQAQQVQQAQQCEEESTGGSAAQAEEQAEEEQVEEAEEAEGLGEGTGLDDWESGEW